MLDFLASGSAQAAPPGWLNFLPIIGMIAIFWFLLIRPQMRQAKAHREKVAGLKKGDQVVTAGYTLYPRDLVLGNVVDAGFDETGVAKFAILEPAADFGSLEQVFVLTSYKTE